MRGGGRRARRWLQKGPRRRLDLRDWGEMAVEKNRLSHSVLQEKGEVRVRIDAQPRDLASILVEDCGRWSYGEVEFQKDPQFDLETRW
jgi:hypothetical protein